MNRKFASLFNIKWLLLCLLLPNLVFAQIVSVEKNGQVFLCQRGTTVWEAGQYDNKQKFVLFRVLKKTNAKKYRQTGKATFLKLSKKYTQLHKLGLESCREFCGNSNVDSGEQCDDGNNVDTDDCRNNCTLPFCGDGIIDNTAQCDHVPPTIS